MTNRETMYVCADCGFVARNPLELQKHECRERPDMVNHLELRKIPKPSPVSAIKVYASNFEGTVTGEAFNDLFSYISEKEAEICQLKDKINRLKRGGWFSVKERLPKLYEDVLVFVNAGKHSLLSTGHLTPDDRWYWNRNAIIFNGAEVTHWQPLPEPPKEGCT